MSFLSRVLVIIGLSFVMTLILMVIHWEPEPTVVDKPVETTAPAPIAAGREPTIEPAIVQTATGKASHDGLPTEAPKERRLEEGIDPAFAPRATAGQAWVMQDAQDIEELPAGVRAALAGCMVPRSTGLPNVITGEFKQAGESRGPQRGSRAGVEADLAVLCVRGPHAAVYVFWGGNHAGAEIAADVDFIPGTYIRTATAADIGVEVRRELPVEPGMPLRIRHDGIQLGNDCCATTHYWHRGRWRSYVSAD